MHAQLGASGHTLWKEDVGALKGESLVLEKDC